MAKKPKKKPDQPKVIVPVKCKALEDNVWAGGAGFLAKGDVAVIAYERAQSLIDEGLVEEVKL